MSITVLPSRTMLLCSIFLVVVSLSSLHQRTTAQNSSSIKKINSSHILFGNTRLTDQEWHYVRFKKNLSEPVVIVGPPTYNNKDIIQIQVNKVAESGFHIRLSKYECVSGTELSETTSWIAISSGVYHNDLDQMIFVGKTMVTESDEKPSNMTKTTLPMPFRKPVAMSFMQQNDIARHDVGNIPLSRVGNLTVSSISLTIEREKHHTNNVSRMVGYFVFEKGIGILDGMKYYVSFKPPSDVKKSITSMLGKVQIYHYLIHPLIIAASSQHVLLRKDKASANSDLDLIAVQANKCGIEPLTTKDIVVDFLAFDFVAPVETLPSNSTATMTTATIAQDGKKIKTEDRNNKVSQCYKSVIATTTTTTATTTKTGTKTEERL